MDPIEVEMTGPINQKQTPRFPALVVGVEEERMLRASYEQIAAPARRKPDAIYAIRHKGADDHVAVLKLTRDACARSHSPEARQACVLAALAFVAHTELALLAMLDQVDGGCPAEAQDADLDEDRHEKRFDLQPTPRHARELLEAKLRSIVLERAACRTLRPIAMQDFASRRA